MFLSRYSSQCSMYWASIHSNRKGSTWYRKYPLAHLPQVTISPISLVKSPSLEESLEDSLESSSMDCTTPLSIRCFWPLDIPIIHLFCSSSPNLISNNFLVLDLFKISSRSISESPFSSVTASSPLAVMYSSFSEFFPFSSFWVSKEVMVMYFMQKGICCSHWIRSALFLFPSKALIIFFPKEKSLVWALTRFRGLFCIANPEKQS